MRNLDLWYPTSTSTRSLALAAQRRELEGAEAVERNVAKAQSKDSMRAFAKLTTMVDGEPRIVSDPPLIVPIEDVASGVELETIDAFVTT